MSHRPRHVALCGYPGAGKSEVQRLLLELYGIKPVDDGYVLREFAVQKLGLSWDDVMTQEGKARHTTVLGRDWENRDILGSLGRQLEDLFGEHILPHIALTAHNATNPGEIASFGSVRKTQGHFFKQHGGIVVELVSPGCAPRYDFDEYDRTAVDITIDNPRESIRALRRQVLEVFDPLFASSPRFDVV